MVANDENSEAEVSLTERLELLASKRRRTVLELLAASGTAVHSLESLATAVTQAEQGADADAQPARRVRLCLHHVHLPKLDAAGLVAYDPGCHVVEYTGSGAVEQLLETVE
ncbi:DUF7344 domain-containing protein [Haloarcula laminariae]|uniref:DUF7344 domain-containing protein n=1 Tax=Haloarcula laminariae TaxID=2961577 RepID=UPI00240623DF|nr:hypothetical protein [Halomicroarcula sp. FL173]